MSAGSKQCVLRAVERGQTGRIPSDFHAAPAVVENLCRAFGISNGLGPLLRFLGADVVDIRGTVDPRWIADFRPKWTLENGDVRNYLGFTTRAVQTPYGMLEEHVEGALAHAETLEDVMDFAYPQTDWFDYSNLRDALKPYEEFCVMASGPSYFQHASFLRGLENLLCDYLVNPDIARLIGEKYAAYYLDHMRNLLDAAGGQIDVVRIADDLGTQKAPLISLELAREFLFPHIRAMCAMVHAHGAKVMMHSCGSVESFFPELIGCGVDILDPLQPRAVGMDFERLYARYHRDVCLHGAVDTQYTLPRATPKEVRAQVLDLLKTACDGAFIIAPAHAVQPDVPPENVLAMYQAIREFHAEG